MQLTFSASEKRWRSRKGEEFKKDSLKIQDACSTGRKQSCMNHTKKKIESHRRSTKCISRLLERDPRPPSAPAETALRLKEETTLLNRLFGLQAVYLFCLHTHKWVNKRYTKIRFYSVSLKKSRRCSFSLCISLGSLILARCFELHKAIAPLSFQNTFKKRRSTAQTRRSTAHQQENPPKPLNCGE